MKKPGRIVSAVELEVPPYLSGPPNETLEQFLRRLIEGGHVPDDLVSGASAVLDVGGDPLPMSRLSLAGWAGQDRD